MLVAKLLETSQVDTKLFHKVDRGTVQRDQRRWRLSLPVSPSGLLILHRACIIVELVAFIHSYEAFSQSLEGWC